MHQQFLAELNPHPTVNALRNNIWKFDAAGRMTDWLETTQGISALQDEGAITTFDGDGRAAKRLNRRRNRHNGNQTFYEEAEYTIYSSVTGQKITSPLKEAIDEKLFDQTLNGVTDNLQEKITNLIQNPMVTDIKISSPSKKRNKKNLKRNKT